MKRESISKNFQPSSKHLLRLIEKQVKTNGKITVKLTRRFCKLIRKGLPIDGICDYLGINSSTFWNWKQKGQKYLDGGGEPKEDAIYGYFVLKTRKALAMFRLRRITSMQRRNNDLWTRDMAILERRDRLNFSKREPEGGIEEEADPDERFL